MEEDDNANSLFERDAGAEELARGVRVGAVEAFGFALVEGDGGEALLKAGAAGFEPRGKAEALAE